MNSLSQKDIERFWGRVDKESSTTFYNGLPCWEWKGSLNTWGYGQISIGNKNRQAHRVSYELNFGEIPNGLLVCHHCDNRKCVNPQHFFLGTNQDNLSDRNNKNRQAFGNRNGSRTHPECRPQGENNTAHKLTNQQVKEIRQRYKNKEKVSELGKVFGVAWSTIDKIIKHKTWK